ncbi:Copper binding protein, plastocyanin/azurin family [Candidatus Rhodobacter oscarellae]|uniref:Copper binding protein, plastocyanin/azurin family n=1 Tax=Candidatus Rhodobacter oscarellae TaxID=1675527 RepID=A0A0J9E1W3_9RHOB|nr:cupredoxin family copper-binding protein [Candidatus Rhodobacter lobularis]KMW56705.1 Copper binding protein, plastocyanin/azurin family [Candidatus Rhodobacter lobularis]
MPRISRRSAIAALALAPMVFAAQTALAATHEVSIQGFAFSPASLEVAVGDTVVFTNQDSAPHTATANNGAFDTGRLGRGDSAEVTITAAGSFDYFCNIHRRMQAVITAQ